MEKLVTLPIQEIFYLCNSDRKVMMVSLLLLEATFKFSRLKRGGRGGAMILTMEMTMAIAMITIMKCNAVGARRRCYLFPFLLPLSRK